MAVVDSELYYNVVPRRIAPSAADAPLPKAGELFWDSDRGAFSFKPSSTAAAVLAATQGMTGNLDLSSLSLLTLPGGVSFAGTGNSGNGVNLSQLGGLTGLVVGLGDGGFQTANLISSDATILIEHGDGVEADIDLRINPNTALPIPNGTRGDVVITDAGATWTVKSGVITNTKLAQMAGIGIKGRITDSAGSVADLSPSEVTSVLPVFSSTAKGLAPALPGVATGYRVLFDNGWANLPSAMDPSLFPQPSSAVPLSIALTGPGSAGKANVFARADHIHPIGEGVITHRGGLIDGVLSLAATPSEPQHAVNKGYLDSALRINTTRPGPAPWGKLQLWQPNTPYQDAAPASLVKLVRGIYVCTTAHTSGAGFDATKWQLVGYATEEALELLDTAVKAANQASAAAASVHADAVSTQEYLAQVVADTAEVTANATAAAASASAAASSATSAASSATAAASSETAAASSATAAATSATSAASSATAAASSETAAASSQTSAASSATSAASSATAAATSETNAATSASSAASSASAADTSATASAASAAAASASASGSATSAAAAASSATAASGSASAAATSASAAGASETNAATSETNAASSASAASTSASNAAYSASAASASEANALTYANMAIAYSESMAWGYVFDTGTADADPGSAKLRFDNATFMSATYLYISETADEGNLAALMDVWDDSTSSAKAEVEIRNPLSPTQWYDFYITGSIVDAGTYRKVPIQPVAYGNAVSNGAAVRLAVTRNGDAGTGAVDSFNGRIGSVSPAANDYAVTQLQSIAANSIIGNNTGVSAAPAVLTTTQVKSLLAIAAGDVSGLAASATTDATNASNISSGTIGGARLPTPSSTVLGGINSLAAVAHNFITSIGTDGVPVAAQPAFSDVSGSVADTQMPALTGDVTTSAGAVVTTIANGAVTLAKMADLAANSIIGNNTASPGVPIALTTSQVKSLLAIAAGDVSGLGSLATASSVTAAQISDASANGRALITAANYAAMKTLLAIAAGDVSGLAASATTDATNANNIGSGTLAAARGGAGTTNGILKANGSGAVSAAVAGTDYQAPLTKASAAEAQAGTEDTHYLTSAKARDAMGVALINTQTASYTLVLGDAGKIVEMNVASANNLTVPPNSSVAFPVGTYIDLSQIGAGQTTIVPGSGVTVSASGAKNKLYGQHSGASLYKRATDTWQLIGDIA